MKLPERLIQRARDAGDVMCTVVARFGAVLISVDFALGEILRERLGPLLKPPLREVSVLMVGAEFRLD